MFFECWHVWIGGSLEDLVLLPDEVGVQEALFLESDPVALAAADTGEGNQSNCYLVVLMIVGSQFESLERPAVDPAPKLRVHVCTLPAVSLRQE